MMKLAPARSTEPVTWIARGIRDPAEDVSSLLPAGLEAYVRVLHPAWTGGSDGRPVTWAEVAEASNRVIHPESQWPHVAFVTEVTDVDQLNKPPPGAPWESAPSDGCIPLDHTRAVSRILARHTSTPQDCYFAAWDGWGGLPTEIRVAPAFELPARRYFLLQGPVDAAAESLYGQDDSYQSAALWWPSDEAWCVATDVDLESTYIGGSHQAIDEILSEPDLEALRVELSTGVTWFSDRINANPLRLR